MATVGQTGYLTPDIGWKRIEETSPLITFSGTWNSAAYSDLYSGGYMKWAASGASIKIRFYGTKIRIITTKESNHGNNTITIDGVSETYNTYSPNKQYAVLSYEKTGLELGYHDVTITCESGKYFTLDAVEIDDTGYFIGQLTAPEAGWKRYDDRNPAIKYTGIWSLNSPSGVYNNTEHISNDFSSTIQFDFIGTKLRIITATWSDHTSQVSIKIDGVEYIYSENGSNTYQILIFEQLNLENKRHSVIIKKYSNDTKYFGLDAIDIDSTGRLLHPDEVLDPKDLSVGKRIRCHYQASSGQVGTFSGLGQETSDFIPPASSATPNGDFYFIMVEDWNGKKKLIADRNIQHSISWDTLNNVGIASGSGLPLDYVADFNGNNCFVEDRSDLQITGDLTANIKFLLRSYPPSSSYKYIFQCGANGESEATNVLYGLMIQPDGTLSIAHEYGTSASNIIINTPYKIPLNTIVDITVSRNSTLKKYTLFVNDIYQGEFSYSNNPTKAISGSSQKLYIGADTTANRSSLNYTNMILYNFSLDTTFIDNLSYDEYKQTKYDEGKLYNLNPLSTKNISAIIRLLTGGVQSGDTQNEWDQYIVSSTLNGTITAGDNNVWNWSGIYSWTSTTPSGSSGNRVERGSSSVSAYTSTTSSTSSATIGFRPVLLIEILTNKSFIYINGEYKTWDNNNKQWITVSTSLPSKDIFNNQGINYISTLNRKQTILQQSMNNNGALGSGKVFVTTVDLHKYFDLIGLNVK